MSPFCAVCGKAIGDDEPMCHFEACRVVVLQGGEGGIRMGIEGVDDSGVPAEDLDGRAVEPDLQMKEVYLHTPCGLMAGYKNMPQYNLETIEKLRSRYMRNTPFFFEAMAQTRQVKSRKMATTDSMQLGDSGPTGDKSYYALEVEFKNSLRRLGGTTAITCTREPKSKSAARALASLTNHSLPSTETIEAAVNKDVTGHISSPPRQEKDETEGEAGLIQRLKGAAAEAVDKSDVAAESEADVIQRLKGAVVEAADKSGVPLLGQRKRGRKRKASKTGGRVVRQNLTNKSPPEITVLQQINGVFDSRTTTNIEEQRKFPLLALLGVPLGMKEVDKTARRDVLREILDFNDEHEVAHVYRSGNHHVRHLVKIPSLRRPEYKSIASANRQSRFLDTIMENLAPTEEESAEALCVYLAKRYNASFMKTVEIAKAAERREGGLKMRSSGGIPVWEAAPPDLVMHDGGSRLNPEAVKWNMMYSELLEYRKDHGSCLVPFRKENGIKTKLSCWVERMRTNYREKKPYLTPRRIELLESIGFVWVVNPNNRNNVENPMFSKAVAAKLYYQPTLTAREAMLLSGFDDEEASNDTLKKSLNAVVCKYKNKKSLRQRLAVDRILFTLKSAGTIDKGIAQVFGMTDVAAGLIEDGKLVPANAN